ncbi:hypothetical protein [Elioraea sp.]|uniref:hypothetical protein n=1 Tax=Elioraea sp. TaxID=2185103 RepID=UPI003F6FA615
MIGLVVRDAVGAGMLTKRCDFPVAPARIAMILGSLAEQAFRQALTISQGNWTTFLTRPVLASLLAIAVMQGGRADAVAGDADLAPGGCLILAIFARQRVRRCRSAACSTLRSCSPAARCRSRSSGARSVPAAGPSPRR